MIQLVKMILSYLHTKSNYYFVDVGMIQVLFRLVYVTPGFTFQTVVCASLS